jgi:hypothetical protein
MRDDLISTILKEVKEKGIKKKGQLGPADLESAGWVRREGKEREIENNLSAKTYIMQEIQ